MNLGCGEKIANDFYKKMGIDTFWKISSSSVQLYIKSPRHRDVQYFRPANPEDGFTILQEY